MNKYIKIGLAVINTLISVALMAITFSIIANFPQDKVDIDTLVEIVSMSLFVLSIIGSWKVALDKSGLVSLTWRILSFGWIFPILFLLLLNTKELL